MNRVGKRILIIPEGLCEYYYSQALKCSLPRDKQRSISIEMPKPNSENKASQLLDKALKELNKAKQVKNSYDAVWIFFDNDNQPNLSNFFQRLKSTPIKIAYSSICIEHWFIIHLDNNQHAFQSPHQAHHVVKRLWRNEFNQDYHKTKINHFEKLKDKIPIAIKRAEILSNRADEDGIPFEIRNPFFTIQDFIHFFQIL